MASATLRFGRRIHSLLPFRLFVSLTPSGEERVKFLENLLWGQGEKKKTSGEKESEEIFHMDFNLDHRLIPPYYH